MELYIIIGIVVAVLYFWYAAIVSRRNKVLESLSGIDVQLKKRADLIPNVLEIAKKFMEHESKLFEEITSLRESITRDYDKADSTQVKAHLEKAGALSNAMKSLMVRAESYPELKSSQNMLQAQQTYNEVEEQISASRRFYNSAVNSLRNSIQIFPGNVLAGIVGAKEMPFFEAAEGDKKSVNAKDFLN